MIVSAAEYVRSSVAPSVRFLYTTVRLRRIDYVSIVQIRRDAMPLRLFLAVYSSV